MTATDVVVDRIDVRATGVAVEQPCTGAIPLGHLVVVVGVHDAAEAVAESARVTAGLHGTLDLVEATALGSGRWELEIPAVWLESEFRLTVRAHTARGVHELLVVDGRNARFGARPDGVRPLLMHQLGRAGSTMMMRLLAGHPEIAVFDDYPLETRPGLAWMHDLSVLLGTQTVRPGDEPFFDEVDVATANPYVSEYFLGAEILGAQHRGGFERLRAVVADMVEDTYLPVGPVRRSSRRSSASRVATRLARSRPRSPPGRGPVRSSWFATRETCCVRGCRSTGSAPRRASTSTSPTMRSPVRRPSSTICDSRRSRSRRFPMRSSSDTRTSSNDRLRRRRRSSSAWAWDHGFATVRVAVDHAVTARSDEHVTTASAAASIGRWRSELPPAAAAHLVDELADELARFGYDR